MASTMMYVSHAHTKEIIDQYLGEAEEVWKEIAHALRDGTLEGLLEGPVCHSDFARLT